METLEKRRSSRQRVLNGARIVLNDGNSIVSCQVRNISERGVLLRLPSVVGMPSRSMLLMEDGLSHCCRQMRVSSTEIGVEFEPGA